jgi:hypothetical protein
LGKRDCRLISEIGGGLLLKVQDLPFPLSDDNAVLDDAVKDDPL